MVASSSFDASLPQLSLLWPAGAPPVGLAAALYSESAAEDLNLVEVVQAMLGGEGPPVRLQQRERFARQLLSQLSQQAEVIAYRQDVLEDLLTQHALRERLGQLLASFETLLDAGSTVPERYLAPGREALERIARRLGELELYVETARNLHDALQQAKPTSAGFQRLRNELAKLLASDGFAALETELPALRSTLASVKSVTIGINFGTDLTPESATILEFGAERIDGRQALLGRLLGGWGAAHALTPLRRGERSPAAWQNDLARDLYRLLQDVAAPVASALRGYASVSVHALGRLGPELAFLLGGARLVERLHTAGLPTCRPEPLPLELRSTELEDAYDPVLALRLSAPGSVVTNPVTLAATAARVWVLSGPNRGGKTTFTRAIGLAHVLGQAGLHVAARSARLSPADAIVTHFPSSESARPGMGRLDDEAERLAAIFRQATPYSLVLLNEALSGTSSFEALDLARDVVRGLRFLGVRAIYVTHLHELGTAVAEINATTPGDSAVGSLIAEAGTHSNENGQGNRTFRIRPGAPHGQSFAADIAEQHGISYPQLVELLRERGFGISL